MEFDLGDILEAISGIIFNRSGIVSRFKILRHLYGDKLTMKTMQHYMVESQNDIRKQLPFLDDEFVVIGLRKITQVHENKYIPLSKKQEIYEEFCIECKKRFGDKHQLEKVG